MQNRGNNLNLIPCLFDRLVDSDPKNQHDQAKSLRNNSLELRGIVLRDLANLLNTRIHDQGRVHDFDNYPEVKTSVLNYGCYDLTGKILKSPDLGTFENSLKQSIWRFEPRICRDDLSVKILSDPIMQNTNALTIEIKGSIWGNPDREPFLINGRMDFENGYVDLALA